MIGISATDFPTLDGIKSYRWAPVLFQPIMGSPEQLVVAVVAFSALERYLATATALSRLDCFYGANAAWSRIAVEETLAEFSLDIERRGESAITDPVLLFSGFSIGAIDQGDGLSAKQTAEFWLNSISSLHNDQVRIKAFDELLEVAVEVDERGRNDRLPILVFDFIERTKPSLKKFFSEEIQSRRLRQSKLRAHEVQIDYAGSKVVANFGTLKATQTLPSVNLLKRRMWDLKVHRDTREGGITARNHELFVFHPTHKDPLITNRQSDAIERAIDSMIKEADIENIRLRPFHSVDEIARKLVELEGLAA